MKRTSIFILAASIGLALLMPPKAHADFWGGGSKEGHEEMRAKMEERIQGIYDQLSLSDEQKKLLQDNKAKHKSSKDELIKDRKAAMQTMGEELKKKDLDMGRINVLHSQLKEINDKMADERLNAILEVRRILTQEQFAKFSELMEEQKPKW
jgi:Spy/CpxP family protein refolding chaperone